MQETPDQNLKKKLLVVRLQLISVFLTIGFPVTLMWAVPKGMLLIGRALRHSGRWLQRIFAKPIQIYLHEKGPLRFVQRLLIKYQELKDTSNKELQTPEISHE